jgi:hypothetical protein
MATKPKTSPKKAAPKKAAPKKAAPKQAADLFNQPAAPKAKAKTTAKTTAKAPTKPAATAKSPSVAKPRYTIKGGKVSPKTASTSKYSLSTKAPQKGPINPNRPKSPVVSKMTKSPAGFSLSQAAPKKGPFNPVAKSVAKSTEKPVAKSLATKLGSAVKGKGKAGLLGGLLAAGTAAAYSAYKRGTGTTKKKAAETPSKGAAPVSIIKDYNRRDDVGQPLTPTVLNKPAAPKVGGGAKASTPSKGGAKSKGKSSAAPKRQAPIALAKGIGAKDIKLSTPATIGKPEIKNVSFATKSTASSATESKPKYSEKRIERMENRAERKAERKENRSERLEKRAGKLKAKLKYGGSMKAKSGKSFPDLNKDGKITKADILKGRGVIAKKGTSIRKAGLGDILGKVAGSGAFGLAGMAANKLFGGKKKTEAAPGMTSPAMKKGGKVAAKTMKSGGKMAKCKYGCK